MINSITLNNGVDMPLLGLGTMQVKDIETILPQAIKLGYRLIDTAANYDNETEVGKGIRASQIDRSQLFITSKLKIQTNGYDGTMKAFNESLERLQLDYLDLYLIHQPYGDVLGEWRALEELYRQGKIKAIGVSNFAPFQLIDLIMHSDVKPAINQIEIHPFYQENRATVYNQRQSVQTEAWAPFGEMLGVLQQLPTLKSIAENHHKTVAQIILRWLLQRNIVAIPRSGNLDHLKANLAIFDFTLSATEMDLIRQLNTHHSTFIDHLTADGAEFLSKVN
ncbi:aldo/keto reductase [Lactiplantibacillus pentosus]|uniref:aldo/keto reductase n=1 Tax=Lactiplantibacillus pentosus TaxID=1589 RepID=UPI0013306061|nr:aldo/keto reductase [Lactiplantibacillus pentosus]MBQ0837692.1 aldo/keto reductase [Lactiplantibacillus pentosus]MBU7464536.1 aldo/keto reductase [Lactiplantibacillus pentosus]MBU7490198.1 aldo/keto reductase [Lactiplantibacillus pentosus]MBU7495129.1 aldo/keto reductase [Lactiplantibacillus pentosus]MBU7521075.1 aldo/keto reductase [Lactiplantibacillus pentosus]